jgi:hypothetical protein
MANPIAMVNKAKAAFAVFMFVKQILSDDELKESILMILNALEDVFDAIPGDFPDNIIDLFQGYLGAPPDEVVEFVVEDLVE